jgi:hypothetical protein
MQACGDREKDQGFEIELKILENKLERAIEEATKILKLKYPEFLKNDEEIKVFIKTNLTCICRTQINKMGVLSILPIFYIESTSLPNECSFFNIPNTCHQNYSHLLLDIKVKKGKNNIIDFVNDMGVRLGSVRGRMQIAEFFPVEQFIPQMRGTLVKYADVGENIRYFPRRLDLINTNLFKRLLVKFNSEEMPAHAAILGKATLELTRGLLNEIDDRSWELINNNPDTREIIQTSLYRAMIHLATAENKIEDFISFTRSIELIHYEISTLLFLFSPFKDGDFTKICQNRLRIVPKELLPYLRAGITKSAMNSFAFINMGLCKMLSGTPNTLCDPSSYFELTELISNRRSSQKEVLGQLPDLYVSEFNHNVALFSSHDEYAPTDVIGDVQRLINDREKPLTVAIDSTIDYVNSDKARRVLDHFSEEIANGKLNFIFFRSGQKYDILGMDNYYGSPFYMVNNGKPQWSSFNEVQEHEAFQTDELSNQWFCLLYKYAPQAMDEYRSRIFSNTRKILQNVPENLMPGQNPYIKICAIQDGVDAGFIDIKCYAELSMRRANEIRAALFQKFIERGAAIHVRGGYGFFYTNVTIYSRGLDEKETDKSYKTIRINPGLNPTDADIVIEFIQELSDQYTFYGKKTVEEDLS